MIIEPDRREVRVRERLESLRARSQKATSWRSATRYLSGLVNSSGHVPVRARLSRADLTFLAGAREDVLAYAELGMRLLELHRPQDAGGITSDPGHPILRCHACMWRWPCPTFRVLEEST